MKLLRSGLGGAALAVAMALIVVSPARADNVSATSELGSLIADANLPDSAPIKKFADGLAKMSASEQQATLDKAGAIATTSGAPQAAAAASMAAAGAAGSRTGMGTPTGNLVSMSTDGTVTKGASAGDGYKNGVGVWLMPLFKHLTAWDLEAGDSQYGFTTNLGGLALGVDYTFDNAVRLGISGNFGWGYAQSNGDGPKANTNFNFWGLSLYGGWQKDNFGVSADLGYTSTNSDSTTDMPGGDWKSDILTTAITAGLRFEYKFATDLVDIMPHVGVRYTHLATYEFDTESGGATVATTDRLDQDIWNFPIGVEFSKDITINNGWRVRPMIDLAVIPAAGEIQKESKSYLVVGDNRMNNFTDVQMMDWFGWQGRAGLSFTNGDVTIGATYTYQGSAHTAGHAGELQLRYDF